MKKLLYVLGWTLLSAPVLLADSTISFGTAPAGVLPPTWTFDSVVASGFSSPGVPTALFSKPGPSSGPASETGLGLAGGLDHEISGTFFIQLDVAKLLAGHSGSISVDSIQGSDAYNVWGSHTAGELGTELLTKQTGFSAAIPNFGHDQFISVTAADGTVLLDNLEVQTPESSVLLLLGVGLAAIVLLRRKLT
jgi:hypothetical protein